MTGAAIGAASTFGGPAVATSSADTGRKWYRLFDSKTLNGWTPKIRFEDLGDDRNATYRAADGMIQIRYDKYGSFEHKPGALYFNEPFSTYRLRFEYRIVGQLCQGAPGWSARRSGVMIHAEDSRLLEKDRYSPVGLSVLLLAGDGTNWRDTACLYTNGTQVVHDGKLRTERWLGTSSKTFHGEQWVKLELEVHGAGTVVHSINDETVLTYDKLQYDPNDEHARKLIRGDGILALEGGAISLSSDGHPADFRSIEIMPLD
ncbi:MAG: 3-keto-disaccharide hydrolase [Planctomycetia bacterium]